MFEKNRMKRLMNALDAKRKNSNYILVDLEYVIDGEIVILMTKIEIDGKKILKVHDKQRIAKSSIEMSSVVFPSRPHVQDAVENFLKYRKKQ